MRNNNRPFLIGQHDEHSGQPSTSIILENVTAYWNATIVEDRTQILTTCATGWDYHVAHTLVDFVTRIKHEKDCFKVRAMTAER